MKRVNGLAVVEFVSEDVPVGATMFRDVYTIWSVWHCYYRLLYVGLAKGSL